MNVIFQRELYVDIIEEALPLLTKHWEEIAWRRDKVPLSIADDVYRIIEHQGQLICFSARKGGLLVGYANFFLRPNPHYNQTMFATNDVIYVSPSYRGITGTKFTDFIEDELKALGAQVISYHVKEQLDWGSMLKRKHFDKVDSIWLKWVGE